MYKNKKDRWQMWPKLTEKSEAKSANTKLSFVVELTNELNMVNILKVWINDLKSGTVPQI